MPTLEERLAKVRGAAQTMGPTKGLADRLASLRQKAAPSSPDTIQDTAKDVFGFKDFAYRGAVLPFGEDEQGNKELAVPGILKDLMTSALLPGHVAQGGAYAPEDATKFALDFAVPAVAGRAPGASRPAQASRRSLVENAPTTEQLKGASRTAKSSAMSGGVTVAPERNLDLLADMETVLVSNKMNPGLHPKTTSAFDQLSKAVGESPDMEDLQIARRLIGVAERTGVDDDARLAGEMRRMLDDFVDNLTPDDVASGSPEGVASKLREFRANWAMAKKSETIEDIIAKAQTQGSGFENGIRIGFRGLLNDKRRIRGFSKEERALMKQIVQGKGTNLLRTLGRLSFGTRGNNFLGGSIGTGAGSFLAGPVGAVAAPVLGGMAAKGADAAAMRNAELMRAIAATGGRVPQAQNAQRVIEQMLLKGAGPTAGTQIQQYDPDIL